MQSLRGISRLKNAVCYKTRDWIEKHNPAFQVKKNLLGDLEIQLFVYTSVLRNFTLYTRTGVINSVIWIHRWKF